MAAGHKLNGRSAQWPEVALQASPARTLLLLAGSVGLSLLGAAMAFGGLDDIEPWSKGWLAGWACLIFFPLCGVLGLKQLFTGGPIVTVGPRGVRDTRISPNWIPWAAITGISETATKGTHYLMMRIDPAFEATMSLTRLARLTRPGNAALGYRGYGIAAAGLKGGFKALKRAIEDGLVRANGG
jgi:hypothetical protein